MQIIVQCSRRHQNLLENWLIGKFSEWHECDVFSWPSKHFNTNTLTVRVWFHNPRRCPPCPPPMPARGETPKLWVRYREKIDIFRNPTVVKFCLKFPPDPEWWEGNKRRASEWVREREQRRGCKRKDPHPIPNFPLLWRVRKLLGEISPPIRRWICVSMIRVQHTPTHTHTHINSPRPIFEPISLAAKFMRLRQIIIDFRFRKRGNYEEAPCEGRNFANSI